ncbi:hypothetical protein GCM10023258_06810 [Terrabacter aeriphilus]|uniref:Uncharacterized protein n=1 Tax=Terrabacter aeriphilus TaxID=515662 RepID=A0ABP9J3B4_9MICO
MADPGERDRVLGAGDDEPLLGGIPGAPPREDVRLVAHQGDLVLLLGAQLVDGDDLLVEVVERRAGRCQPVLEDRHVARAVVVAVEVAHRADREVRVLPVLLGGQRARAGELAVVGRAVDVVAPGDDHLVVAREEADGLALEVVLRERLGVGPLGAPRAHPDAREGRDVRPPTRAREVCRPARAGGRGRLPAVGQVPVVVAEDLEEVRDEPELRHGLVEVVGEHTAHLAPPRVVPHEPGDLGRRLALARRAERAVRVVVGGVDGQGVVDRLAERSRRPARQRPHLRPGDGVDLLDGAVRQAGQRLDHGSITRPA